MSPYKLRRFVSPSIDFPLEYTFLVTFFKLQQYTRGSWSEKKITEISKTIMMKTKSTNTSYSQAVKTRTVKETKSIFNKQDLKDEG